MTGQKSVGEHGQYECVSRQTASRAHQRYQEIYLAYVRIIRGLNKTTKIFENPIPRCDDAITIFHVGSNIIWIITVDARQLYHQVLVHAMDKEKLALFAPDEKKSCFK